MCVLLLRFEQVTTIAKVDREMESVKLVQLIEDGINKSMCVSKNAKRLEQQMKNYTSKEKKNRRREQVDELRILSRLVYLSVRRTHVQVNLFH